MFGSVGAAFDMEEDTPSTMSIALIPMAAVANSLSLSSAIPVIGIHQPCPPLVV